MFTRIKLVLAVFLAILVGVLIFWNILVRAENKSLKTAKTVLESNNQLLISKMKRAYDDKVEYSRKAQELEDLAKRAVNFDWHRDISNDELILWLHENAIRVQGSRARAN